VKVGDGPAEAPRGGKGTQGGGGGGDSGVARDWQRPGHGGIGWAVLRRTVGINRGGRRVIDRWVLCYSDGRHWLILIQNQIQIQIKSLQSFTDSKMHLPELKQFEIKYGCEVFEERNNFIHRSFFKLEMDFK
jgi:hypothetical protein